MADPIKRMIREVFKRCNLVVMSSGRYERLNAGNEDLARLKSAINLILQLPEHHRAELLTVASYSKAQLFQDLFALSELGFKRNGFFVEFGATNGIDLSNTFLLETRFGWRGILAEPGRDWHMALKESRTCHIEHSCVWRDSNSKLTFNAVDLAEFSTIDSFTSSDCHAKRRGSGRKYEVDTISLADLLDKYNAPPVIDYLSIDTEGSEYEILQAFDFQKHKFRVITCEHNFTPNREKLLTLLTKNGYERRLEGLSDFDDWYVHVDANCSSNKTP